MLLGQFGVRAARLGLVTFAATGTQQQGGAEQGQCVEWFHRAAPERRLVKPIQVATIASTVTIADSTKPVGIMA